MSASTLSSIPTQPANSTNNTTQRQSLLGALAHLSRRHPIGSFIVSLVVIGTIVLAIGGYFLGWTWTGFKGNTFWDWMSLLITPVTLATISLVFSLQQSRGSIEASTQQQQEAIVAAYFDHISHLLLESRLLETAPDHPARAMARARTIATLQLVGQQHQTVILHFLDECGLTTGAPPVLDLRTTNFGEPQAV